MALPPTVNRQDWERAHAALLEQEKAATRASDALAAERRRQPAVEISAGHTFDGPDGPVTLGDLFEGRTQLILYHFMFPATGDPCTGCSMFADQVGHLAHFHARDTSLALVSRAPQAQLQAFRGRMGWAMPWYTATSAGFEEECGVAPGAFGLNVLLRDEDRVLLSYLTTSRGVEALGSVWSFLDRTPLGRQENWEVTPAGRPQTTPYGWWRLHDQYEPAPA